MTDPGNDFSEVTEEIVKKEVQRDISIDTITGNKISSSPKKESCLKILRQIFEHYGSNPSDL